MSAKFKSNKNAVLSQYNQNAAKALAMIGMAQNEIASMEVSALGAIDSGNLHDSMGYFVDDKDDKSVVVGNTVDYAHFVELGTRNMGARPFLRNSINNHKGTYRSIVQDTLGEGFDS